MRSGKLKRKKYNKRYYEAHRTSKREYKVNFYSIHWSSERKKDERTSTKFQKPHENILQPYR